jgi:hypothetical protein
MKNPCFSSLNRQYIKFVGLLIFFMVQACFQSIAQTTGSPSIKISDNGRYFTDGKGKPLFWQGDTEWDLFQQLTFSEAKSLLIERQKQGFNFFQVMATGVYPEWAKMTKSESWKGSEAWLNNNPLTPNEDYFKRTDSIVAFAEKNDLSLVVGVYHAQDVDKGRISMQNAKQWAYWLAKRYKNSKNIIWSMYPHAVEASKPIIEATVQGLHEGDEGIHFITMHPDPSPTSSSFMNSSSWLSFNTLQTWSTNFSNYEMVKADYEKMPVRPVVNGEARYEEEDGTTAFESRRAGYWACLAGGFYSYGHRDDWKSPRTWRDWYNTPGARQIKIFGDIFRSISWWKLIPDQSVFVNQIKGNAAARSKDGDWILVYLTNAEPVIIRMNKITVSKSVTAWWIDPLTGNKSKIKTLPTIENHTFNPPKGCEDAVLLITK